MASWRAPWSGQYLFKTAIRFVIVLGLSVGAWAQSGSSGNALPPLPAVQDEGSEGSGAPLAPTASAAGATSAPVAADSTAGPTPAPKGRFASVAEARERIREAFALRNYSAVLGMAEDIHKQFPEESFVRYYETMARLQLRDHSTEGSRIPYKRLDSLPSSEGTNAAPPAATPAAKAAATSAGATAQSPVTLTPARTPAASSTPAPRVTPLLTPALTPAATPASRIATPPPARSGAWYDDLVDFYNDNQPLVLYGGGGALSLVAVIGVLLRRRRRAAEEEADDEEEDLFAKAGAASRAPVTPRGSASARVFPPRPDPAPTRAPGGLVPPPLPPQAPAAPARPAPPVPGMRSEVQALSGGALAYGAPQSLLEPETAQSGLEIEPVFSLAETDEPAPAQPAGPYFQPVEPEADPLLSESQIVFDDAVFSLDSEPEPQPEPQPGLPLRPFLSNQAPTLQPPADLPVQERFEDSLLTVNGSAAESQSGSVGESLYLDEVSHFELPVPGASHLPGLSPEPPLEPPFRLEAGLTGGARAPRDAEASDLPQVNPAEPAPGPDAPKPLLSRYGSGLGSGFGEEEFTLSGEETQTGFPLEGADVTMVSGLESYEATSPLEPERPEPPEFQAFRPGETVTVHMMPEEDPPAGEPGERTIISPEPPRENAKRETNVAQDEPQGGQGGSGGPEDVFEREYRQGVRDAEEQNWVGAIHHLSIAAALRPGAMEVKEKLREARRMRARELEGRA